MGNGIEQVFSVLFFQSQKCVCTAEKFWGTTGSLTCYQSIAWKNPCKEDDFFTFWLSHNCCLKEMFGECFAIFNIYDQFFQI